MAGRVSGWVSFCLDTHQLPHDKWPHPVSTPGNPRLESGRATKPIIKKIIRLVRILSNNICPIFVRWPLHICTGCSTITVKSNFSSFMTFFDVLTFPMSILCITGWDIYVFSHETSETVENIWLTNYFWSGPKKTCLFDHFWPLRAVWEALKTP